MIYLRPTCLSTLLRAVVDGVSLRQLLHNVWFNTAAALGVLLISFEAARAGSDNL